MEVKANINNNQTAVITYEEFEPFCKWQRKEDRDVLEIHLPDFKKEQLKVQISNHGLLKISGERPLSSDSLKKTKFYKELPVSGKIYDTASINAKFINNQLHITLPKKKTSPTLNPNEKSSEEKEHKNIDQNPKQESTMKDQSFYEKQKTINPGSIASAEHNFQKRMTRTKLAKVVSTVVVLVVLFAYVVYMYRSTVGDVDEGQLMEWDALDY